MKTHDVSRLVGCTNRQLNKNYMAKEIKWRKDSRIVKKWSEKYIFPQLVKFLYDMYT